MPPLGISARRLSGTYGVFLLARLRAHPETKALLDSWTALQTSLRATTTTVEAAVEERMTSRAALEYADLLLDNAIRKVAAAAKVDVGGNARHPEFGKLFDRQPGEIVALPFDKEIAAAEKLEKDLAASAIWKTAKSLAGELKAARKGLAKAHAAYHAARSSWREALDKEDDAEVDWRHGYRATYGAVVERFAHDKRLQESFFYRERLRAEEEEEEPAPGSGTT